MVLLVKYMKKVMTNVIMFRLNRAPINDFTLKIMSKKFQNDLHSE